KAASSSSTCTRPLTRPPSARSRPRATVSNGPDLMSLMGVRVAQGRPFDSGGDPPPSSAGARVRSGPGSSGLAWLGRSGTGAYRPGVGPGMFASRKSGGRPTVGSGVAAGALLALGLRAATTGVLPDDDRRFEGGRRRSRVGAAICGHVGVGLGLPGNPGADHMDAASRARAPPCRPRPAIVSLRRNGLVSVTIGALARNPNAHAAT